MLLFIDIQSFKKSYSHLFQNAYAMSCLQISFRYLHPTAYLIDMFTWISSLPLNHNYEDTFN